jgi:hypothetical protein
MNTLTSKKQLVPLWPTPPTTTPKTKNTTRTFFQASKKYLAHLLSSSSWTSHSLPAQSSRRNKMAKTYNSGYSLVVTHLTTNPPVHCLSTAERTGSSIFSVLWSYVKGVVKLLVHEVCNGRSEIDMDFIHKAKSEKSAEQLGGGRDTDRNTGRAGAAHPADSYEMYMPQAIIIAEFLFLMNLATLVFPHLALLHRQRQHTPRTPDQPQ